MSKDICARVEAATIWEVDLSVAPAAVTVHDVNSLVSNLPANVTLTQTFAIHGRGTVATGRIETSPASAAAGVSGPYAFFLATAQPAIPAVGTWGMAVLALLVLGIGTAIARNRRVELTPATRRRPQPTEWTG